MTIEQEMTIGGALNAPDVHIDYRALYGEFNRIFDEIRANQKELADEDKRLLHEHLWDLYA